MYLTPETAPPEQLIEAFYGLLRPERFVFSHQDSPALYELIDNLPDDVEAIAEQLRTWSQERRKVNNSLKAALNKRGQSGSIPSSNKQYKELLQNSIRQSFPSPSSQQFDSNPSTQQSGSNQSTND